MNPTSPALDLPTLIALVRSHTWLPVAIALVLYVRGLLSSSSRFPVTIPATWLPFATGLGTMVFSILVTVQGGASVGTALLASATTGTGAMVLDALAVAIWGNDPAKVPVWMKFFLMIAHDVAPPPPATDAAKRGFVSVRALLWTAGAGLVAFWAIAWATACTKQQAQSADQVAIDLTNYVCAQAEGSNAPGWVTVVCTIAQGVEQGVAGGLAVQQVTLQVPAASAASFLAAHKGSK